MRVTARPACYARHLLALGAVVLALTVPGCGGSLGIPTGPIRSQVVDAHTGQPIAGALVLGVWYTVGPGLPGHNSRLAGVREVEADSEGNFTLERPGQRLIEESVTVYSFGYIAWNNLYIFPTSERRKDPEVPHQILMERFPAGQSRQRHASFIRNATRTGYARGSTPKFLEAFRREERMP